MSDSAVLECRGLGRAYRDGDLYVEVLREVNFSLPAAAKVAIIGASGAGKSTLLNLLGGLDVPTAGQVFMLGQDMAKLDEEARCQLRNRQLGFVYQFHHLLAEFSARENVAMPLLIRGESTSEATRRATELLKKVGLDQRLDHKPGELSGGERQRAAVARALVGNPGCILGDEPTGNLDERIANQVFDQLLELNTELKTSLILVTHDMQLAARMTQRFELHLGALKPF